MSDDNQDQPDENEPINILSEAAEGEINDEIALEDIDLLLQEEEPEFLKQISQIQIDDAGVNLSIMDDVISTISAREQKKFNWKSHAKNIFSVQDDPKKFFLFWSLISVSVVVVFFGLKISNSVLSKGLFLRSYSEWGLDANAYNPLSEVELFYDNPRFAKNLMTMTKMVSNIKPSESSGTNPMLALEINVEGLSAESIIEIKDREAEFKDILLRESEEFSYDDLISTEGKKSLLEKYQAAINANLTQGQVRRVLIKSFILKP